MEVALNGNLREFGVAAVFQFIGQQRCSGVLAVRGRRRPLRVFFDRGAVAWAEREVDSPGGELVDALVLGGFVTPERGRAICEESMRSARPPRVVARESGDVTSAELEALLDRLTDDVIFELLLATTGRFDFAAEEVAHDRPEGALLAAEQILMEGLRRVDEWRAFEERLPANEAVLERAPDFEEALRRVRAQDEAAASGLERLWPLVDGRVSVGRVIALSRLGTFEGSRLLVSLLDAGALAIGGRAARGGWPRETVARGAGARLRSLTAALLPVVLLGLAAWRVGEPVFPPSRAGGVPVVARPFERAVAELETLRLRNALDAHRYLWAAWPETLAGLERTGWGGSRALAAPGADTYYYAQRADGLLLLPPDSGPPR